MSDPSGPVPRLETMRARIEEIAATVLRVFDEIDPETGLRSHYRVRGGWSPPALLSLGQMQRTIAELARTGHADEAERLAAYGHARFGQDVILTRRDALRSLAAVLGVSEVALPR